MNPKRLFVAALIAVISTALLPGGDNNIIGIPFLEDPLAGARLFQQKGCTRCHAIGEETAKTGPNLARMHIKGSVLDMAGAIWNHAPAMQRQMREQGINPPRMDSKDMVNLTAFLSAYQYYLQQLGKRGSPEKGQQVFEAKNCSVCHSIKKPGMENKSGPSLAGYTKLSPIQVAQVMWNHGPAMARQFQKFGLPKPEFKGTDMADLIAYLQRAAVPIHAEPVYVEPGSPNRGRALFQKKGCALCHPIRGVGGSPDAPDLGKQHEDFVRNVTEVAGLMWNHSTAMWRIMQKRKVPAIQFKDNEMADIIAYIYFVNYYDKPGDIARGRELFRQKGCAYCHATGKEPAKTGPDLGASVTAGSPIDTITAMWNHASKMELYMPGKGIPWPKFEPGEMADLMAFIFSQNGKTNSSTK